MATGLVFMGGSERLYRKALVTFVATQAGAPEDLRQAIDQGRREAALLRAHTLKGLAGYLGAAALQAAAGRLEGLLGQSESPGHAIDVELQATAQALHAVLAAAQRAFPDGLPEASSLAPRPADA